MRFLGLLLAAFLFMWMIVTAAARLAANEALDKPWPQNLGKLRDVPKRYPPRKTTPEAKALNDIATQIDDAMSEELEQNGLDYLLAQFLKEDDAIDAPPPQLEAFLRDNRQSIEAARGAINGTLEWNEPLPQTAFLDEVDSLAMGKLTRALAIDALQKARTGEAGAWDDVHAIDLVAGPLMRRVSADAMSSALSMMRTANGVARKLPPPVPAWWSDVDQFDARHALLAAMEAQTWNTWSWFDRRRASHPVLELFLSAYQDASTASFINHTREAAEELASMRNCAVDVDALDKHVQLPSWNLMSAYRGVTAFDLQRVRLYDFERDATQRIFAIKEHRPLPSTSRCADGPWRHEDGVLRYSVRIPIKAPGKPVVPQRLRY